MEINADISRDAWIAVRRLFDGATEVEPSRRAEWLRARAEPAVVGEVLALLRADSVEASPLDDPTRFLELTQTGDSTQHEAPRPAGERLGAFEIRGVLGAGQSGVVYRAWQQHPPREVALKVLRSSVWLTGTPGRFHTEVRALARLAHPGIARVFDAGSFEEPGGVRRPYLVAELVEGAQPITAYSAALDRDRKLALILELCEAVSHAHQRGVLHRDLKPGNVLVDADGRVRVIDFGIARLDDDGPRSTLPGQMLGTPAYMSPEQAAGRDTDTRTDVFAIGLLLRDLAAAELSGDLLAVVKKATAPTPEDRYQSVRDLAEEVRRALEYRPIEARPPGMAKRLGMFARRRPALFASLAACTLAILVAVASVAIAASRISVANKDARVAAEFLLDQWLATLEDRIGSLDERVRLSRELLTQVDRLAIHSSDPALIRDRARLLGILGDGLQAQGKLAESLAILDRMLQDREWLAQLSSPTLDDQVAWSIALVRAGDLRGALGRADEQSWFYQQAKKIDEMLLGQHSGNPRLISNLSFSFARLSALAVNRGDLDDAVRLADSHAKLATMRAEQEPENTTAILEQLDASAVLSTTLQAAGREREATALTRERWCAAAALWERNPGSRRAAIRLVSILNAASSDLAGSGDLNSAVTAAERAVHLAQSSCLSDPSDREASRWLARALTTYSSVLLQNGCATEALAAGSQAAQVIFSGLQDPNQLMDRELAELSEHISGLQVESLRALARIDESDTCARRWLVRARAVYNATPPQSLVHASLLLHDALSLISDPTDAEQSEMDSAAECVVSSGDPIPILELGFQSLRANRIDCALRHASFALENARPEQDAVCSRAKELLAKCMRSSDQSP